MRFWCVLLRLLSVTAVLGASLFATETGSTGSGATIDNRQSTLELNYMICADGLYVGPDGSIPRDGEPTVGEIRLVIAPFTPGAENNQWIPCDGRLLPINDYQLLHFVIGTTYGGDGVNTFAIPDLRGRVPVGVGPDLPLGSVVGSATLQLTEAQMPAHSHSLGTASTDASGGADPIDNRQPGLALHHLILIGGVDYTAVGEVVLFAGPQPPLGNARPCDGGFLPINQHTLLYSKLGVTYGGDARTVFALPDLRGRAVVGASGSNAGQGAGADFFVLQSSQLPAHEHSLPAGGSTGSAGAGAAVDNRQRTLVLHYLTVTQGFYPGTGYNTSDLFLADVKIQASPNLSFGIDPALEPLDGREIAIQDNSTLFALIGHRYGGQQNLTFRLPDVRGRLVAGSTLPTLAGQSYGADSYSLSTAQLPVHAHALPVVAPSVSTGSATGIGVSSVTLQGLVNAQGAETSVVFDYGTSPAYGATVSASTPLLSDAGNSPVSATISGLSPGTSYHFRVRATNAGGETTGADASFTTLTRLQAWRLDAYGSTANAGDAADTAAPRGDGLPNLLKFATGLDPAVPALPPGVLTRSGENLEFVYPRSLQAVDELAFFVEWSDTLELASWSTEGVTEQVLGEADGVETVKATLSAGPNGRRFVRLRVER